MVIYSERCVAESNRLKWFCRPVPDRSDNAPCFISFSKANAKVVLLFLLSKYFVYFFSWHFFFLFSLLAVVLHIISKILYANILSNPRFCSARIISLFPTRFFLCACSFGSRRVLFPHSVPRACRCVAGETSCT